MELIVVGANTFSKKQNLYLVPLLKITLKKIVDGL